MDRGDPRAGAPTSAACRLCSRPGRRLFEKDGIPSYRCASCGLVFSVPLVNPNLANELADYEPSYLDYLSETPEDAAEFRALRGWMERFGAVQPGRLLDVGAGSGKWVRHLRAQSVDAHGLEPARALFEHFLARDACFSCDSLERFVADRPEGFERITALDVLEHVEHPAPFLAALARGLCAGGLLFLSTPDSSSVLARLAGKRWHYHNRYHLSLFDRRTLVSALAPHGLSLLGFARRGRKKSLRFLCSYCGDFVLGKRGVRAPDRLQNLVVPINLFDTMDLCFQKDIGATGAVPRG